jgi:hypothetical protein
MNETKEDSRTPLLSGSVDNISSIEAWLAQLGRPLPSKWRRAPWRTSIALFVISAAVMFLPFILIAAKIDIAIAIARLIFIVGFFTFLATLVRQFFLIASQDNSFDERTLAVIENPFGMLYRKTSKAWVVSAFFMALAVIVALAVFYLPAFGITLTDSAVLALQTTAIFLFLFTILGYVGYFQYKASKIPDLKYNSFLTRFFTPKTNFILLFLICFNLFGLGIFDNSDRFFFSMANEAFLGISFETIFYLIMIVVTSIVILERLASAFSSLTLKAKTNLFLDKWLRHLSSSDDNTFLRYTQVRENLSPEQAFALCDILLGISSLEEPKRTRFMAILMRDKRRLQVACTMFCCIPSLHQNSENFMRFIEHLDYLDALSPIINWMDKHDLLKTNGSINQANFDKLLAPDNAANFAEIWRGITALKRVGVFDTQDIVNDAATNQHLSTAQFCFNLLLIHPDCAGSVGSGSALSYESGKLNTPPTEDKKDFLKFEGLQALAKAGLLSEDTTENMQNETVLAFAQLEDETEILHVGRILCLLQKAELLTREHYQSVMRCALNAKELTPILAFIYEHALSDAELRLEAFQLLIGLIQSQGGTSKRLPGILDGLEEALRKLYSSYDDRHRCKYIAKILLANLPLVKFFDLQDFRDFEVRFYYRYFRRHGHGHNYPESHEQAELDKEIEHLGRIFFLLQQCELLNEENYKIVMQWPLEMDVLREEIEKIFDPESNCEKFAQPIAVKELFDFIKLNLPGWAEPAFFCNTLFTHMKAAIPKIADPTNYSLALEAHDTLQPVLYEPGIQDIIGMSISPEFKQFQATVREQLSAADGKKSAIKSAYGSNQASEQKRAAKILTATSTEPTADSKSGLRLGELAGFDPALARSMTALDSKRDPSSAPPTPSAGPIKFFPPPHAPTTSTAGHPSPTALERK